MTIKLDEIYVAPTVNEINETVELSCFCCILGYGD